MTISYLPQTAFVFMLIFSRLGTMLMLMPALGEAVVSGRIRLLLALMITLVMMPVVQSQYGTLPTSLWASISMVVGEIAVGMFVGTSARLVMSVTHVAGTVIAFQTGLAFAQSSDIVQGIQGAIVGSFLSMLAITLIFVMDLHHLLIGAMHASYTMFTPGDVLPLGSFAQMAIDTVTASFKVGIQLSAPFIVFGLMFYFGIGVLSRLMPQIQIFFVAMPANIGVGFLLFMLLLTVMMNWFLEHFKSTLEPFVSGI